MIYARPAQILASASADAYIDLIAAKPMSRRELVEKLTARRPKTRDGRERPPFATQEQAQEAADWLEELGYLNDREYGKTVVRHYSAKGYGERKLRDELYRRGVPREYWEDALGEREPDGDQVLKLARQKLRGAEPTRENLKKVSDYLARRGYGWDEISGALDRLREEEWE